MSREFLIECLRRRANPARDALPVRAARDASTDPAPVRASGPRMQPWWNGIAGWAALPRSFRVKGDAPKGTGSNDSSYRTETCAVS